MRIERLDLRRYGALTDKSFRFRPGAKLHLVYGPNEAGKSSALAAIGDLLFGFPPRKGYDFLHEAGALRVGASLSAADGAALAFRRRRGNKNTILADDESETALRDDALAPFLGSLRREVFERAFGLDSHRLREGAADMLKSAGEAAGTLFAAASGLTGLAGVRGGLETEAAGLFAPRASKDRRFYQILERHEAARLSERENELKAGDWKSLLAEVATHEAALKTLGDNKAEARSQGHRLRRLKQLQPIVAEIDAELAALAEFAEIEGIPARLGGELQAALDGAARARQAVAAVEAQRLAARAALERLVVDDAMLGTAGAVTTLFARIGEYAKDRLDLPRIIAERDGYERQVRQLAVRLGLAAADEVHQPADALLAGLRALVGEGRSTAERLAALQLRLREEREGLAAPGLAPSRELLLDTAPWRERFAALGPDLRRLEGMEERRVRLVGQERRLREQVGRLQPAVDDLDRLAAMPLPGIEVLAEHRQSLGAVAALAADLRKDQRGVGADLERLDRAMAADESGAPIPSREAIAAARATRDGRFRELREALTGLAPLPDSAAIAAFQQAGGEADRLADMALADADRVSRYTANLLQRSELQRQHRALGAAIAQAGEDEATAGAAYRQLFAVAGIVPLGPEAMIGWRREVAALVEERQTLLGLADEVAELEALDSQLRPELEALAVGLGSALGAAVPVATLGRAIADRLGVLERNWGDSRAAAGKREDAARRIERLAAELAEAETQLQDWSRRFAAAAKGVGLGATATLDGALAALDVWEKLPGVGEQRDDRARRVAGMQRDIERFEREVATLVAARAPELAGAAPDMALETLRQRAETARARAARRDEIVAEIERLDAGLAEAGRDGDAAAERLARLGDGLPQGLDLGALVERLRVREALRGSLDKSRQRFRNAAEGLDEAAVRDDLVGFDPDAAAATILALEDNEARLSAESNEHYARLDAARRRRAEFEAGAGTEWTVAQRYAAETEIVEVARQWVVLKLATALLDGAMARQREAEAGPLVRRAGELLALLTGGSLVRLVEDYDESDRPLLKGVRGSGERLGVEAMSEGTRDQLYLALRLAYLEDYARHNEPAPFIGDDIFQTFDDARTMAGIEALALVSQSVQPILFTHHRSVVEAGRRALGDELDLIEW